MPWGNSNAGDQAVALQQQQQQAVQAATGQINNAFSGFTPNFYNQRAQTYENYAAPQLEQQYQTSEANMKDKLGNQGLLDSSAAQQESGALAENLATAENSIANTAIGQSQSLQQQVAQEQANLVGQANAASDPLSVAQNAIGAASSLQTPSAFAPIGNLFQNFANTYLGSQLANTYNPSVYSSFLYNPSSGNSIGSGLPSNNTLN